MLAVSTFFVLATLATKGLALKPEPLARYLLVALWVMACTQVGLGIATLLTHVNVVVATLHQAGAIIILALLMALLHNIPHNSIPHKGKTHARS